MRILIAGGTSFVGRAIAWSTWRAGHDVTVINRGTTPSDLPDPIERLVGDRHGDLSALHGRNFDATVDTIAYRPGDVASLAGALGARGGHHIQISSISAYQDPPSAGLTEADGVLWPGDGLDLDAPISGATYGPLKAAAERAAREHFGEQLTIVRPTFVIGSHDATLRFPYWVERVRRGGDVAVPGPRTNAMQWIDARDLAQFVTGVAEHSTLGAFHVAGPSPSDTFGSMVQQIADHLALGRSTIHEIDPERVDRAGLAAKFPLWSGPDSENMLSINNRRAVEHGLALRSLAESVDDVVDWWGDREWPAHWLTGAEEARLLSSDD